MVLRGLRAAGRSRNVGTTRVRTAWVRTALHGTEYLQRAWVCGSTPRRAGGAGSVGGGRDGAGVDWRRSLWTMIRRYVGVLMLWLLCPYPSEAKYVGGNPNVTTSFECVEIGVWEVGL